MAEARIQTIVNGRQLMMGSIMGVGLLREIRS